MEDRSDYFSGPIAFTFLSDKKKEKKAKPDTKADTPKKPKKPQKPKP